MLFLHAQNAKFFVPLQVKPKHYTMLKLVEHELRKIEFEYDEQKAWTEQDESLLNAYLSLHNHELEHKTTGKDLMQRYGEQNKMIEQARKQLMELKDSFTQTRELADKLSGDILFKKPYRTEPLYEALDHTSQLLQTYDTYMRTIANEGLEKEREAFFDADENTEHWDAFDDANLLHSQNYEVNAIDTSSFFDEEEKFRSFLSVVVTTANNSAMDYINEVINNYNKLMLQTEVQYELYKEFVKRLALIESLTGDSTGGTYFNLN